MFIPRPWCSARDKHMRKDSVLANGHQSTVQDALGVLAARVQAQRAADLDRALGLVDVAVQSQERLVLLDGLTYRFAADSHPLNPGHPDLWAKVVVEKRSVVDVGAKRRAVRVEDACSHVPHLGRHSLEA